MSKKWKPASALFRLTAAFRRAQVDFDADQERREMLMDARDEEIKRMALLLGEAPKQAEKLMTLTSDQEQKLLEKGKRVADLEQKLADMASLSSKVAAEAAASREAASRAEEARAAQQETFDGDVEEAAGQLLRDARTRIAELELDLRHTTGDRDELRDAHEESSAAYEAAAAGLEEATGSLQSLSSTLAEETAERKRLRDENNMLRGR
jgi:septal ring factor EnvC (AmiA/AmiB activator)